MSTSRQIGPHAAPERLPSSLTWSDPGSGITLELDIGLVQNLERVMQREGRAAAGFLLGSTVATGDTVRITLSGLEASRREIVLEYLEDGLPEKEGRSGRMNIAGAYLPGGTHLSGSSSGETASPRTFVVMELVPAASFVFVSAGVAEKLSLFDFPCLVPALARNSWRPFTPEFAASSGPEVPPQEWLPADASPNRKRALQWSSIILCLILLTSGAAYWWSERAPGKEPRVAQNEALPAATAGSQGLGLRVSREGRDLRITWSKDAPEILQADTGGLRIFDGAGQQNYVLDAKQLQHGKVLYVPASKDIKIEFSVIGVNATVSRDIVRILQGGPDEGTFRSRREEARLSVSAPMPAKVTKTFQEPPHLQPSAVTAIASTDVPETSPEAPPPGSLPALSGNIGKPLPSFSAPQDAPVRSLIAPAIPIRQAAPSVTAITRRTIFRRTVISVNLYVDSNGRVTSSKVSEEGVNTELARLALSAANQWKFKPATQNGKPIASEFLVRFVFDP